MKIRKDISAGRLLSRLFEWAFYLGLLCTLLCACLVMPVILFFHFSKSATLWALYGSLMILFGGMAGHFFSRLLGASESYPEFEGGEMPTVEQLDEMERRLGIKLPHSYRDVMLQYPWPVYRGRDGGPIWNRVDRIVKANEDARKVEPDAEAFPTDLLILGEDESLGVYTMRLGDGAVGVPDQDGKFKSIANSLEEFVAAHTEEMRKSGFDPNGKEPPPKSAFVDWPGCITPVILIFLAVWGVGWLIVHYW